MVYFCPFLLPQNIYYWYFARKRAKDYLACGTAILRQFSHWGWGQKGTRHHRDMTGGPCGAVQRTLCRYGGNGCSTADGAVNGGRVKSSRVQRAQSAVCTVYPWAGCTMCGQCHREVGGASFMRRAIVGSRVSLSCKTKKIHSVKKNNLTLCVNMCNSSRGCGGRKILQIC